MMLAVFLNFQFFIIFEKDLYKKNKICSFVTETIMKLCTADVLNMHMVDGTHGHYCLSVEERVFGRSANNFVRLDK